MCHKQTRRVSTLDDSFLYWETCAAVTECPVGGASFFELKIKFTIEATVETFDKTAFKVNLAKFLNADSAETADSVSPNDIKLKVTAGSIQVEATIKAYTESVKSAIVTSLDAADPTALTTALGVKVLSKEPVQAVAYVPSPDGGTMAQNANAGSGLSGGAIAAIVAGVVVVLLLVIAGLAFFMLKKKKKAEKPKAAVQIVTTTAHEESKL